MPNRDLAWSRLPVLVTLGLLAALLGGCKPAEQGPATGGEYVYFPAPPVKARMQYLRSLRGSSDFAARQSSFMDYVAGKDKEAQEGITKAFGVTTLGGNLYVADTLAKVIRVFDIGGSQFRTFGKTGMGTLSKPINIRRGPDDRLYVGDMGRKQVVVFDAEGRHVGAYGTGKEFSPADIAVTDEELYVLDVDEHNVKVFDLRTGEMKRSFGGRGKAPGMFNYPTNMDIGPDGNLYVCDSLNFRIQKLTPEGKPLFQFGGAGRSLGFFSRPRGIAVDRDGIVYVADALLGIVQMFNPQGRVLMHFGESGTDPGKLYLPAQIAIDYDNVELFREHISPDFKAKYLVYVTSQVGPNKVSVYAFGEGPGDAPPPPVARDKPSPTTQPAPQPTPALKPGDEPETGRGSK